MNSYLEQLKAELDSYTSKCSNDRPESVLDLLWYCYSCANSIDDGCIQKCEENLLPIYQELTVTSEETIFDLITELVTAYQRAALLEGLQTGAQLRAWLLNA